MGGGVEIRIRQGLHTPCVEKNPDPYFHRGCGTNACLKYKVERDELYLQGTQRNNLI